VHTLIDTPIGDNDDVSSLDQTVGVVVTPHVPYDEAQAARPLPQRAGLRKASSVGELRRFLAGH
jgi:hypothetical protein